MIVGTGIDAVSIPRFRAFLDRRGERALRRLFTAQEVRYCLDRGDRIASLAARFAAKEAFFKAVGTGWSRGGAWSEVEVIRDAAGRPALRLHGRADRVAGGLGVTNAHVSLSHTADLALAHVLLER